MALIRWNPWNISSIFDEGFELPTAFSRLGLTQGLNLYETEDKIVAEAAMPGIPEDKIDISYEDGIVRISGVKEEKKEEKEGKKRYLMSSMSSSFNYSFRLPEGLIRDEEPEALVENGVLTLTFAKVERKEPKKIKIGKTKNE